MKRFVIIIGLLVVIFTARVEASLGDIIRGTTDFTADVVEGAGDVAADVVDAPFGGPEYVDGPYYRDGYYRDGRDYRRGAFGRRY